MRFGLLLLTILVTSSALGSGWIKGPDQFYGKGSVSLTQDRVYAALPLAETETTYGLYLEYGLPLSLATQVQLYSAVRETTRVATETEDQFSSRGFTDTELRIRSQVWLHEVGQAGKILAAAGLGAMLPSTSAEFRLGNEDERSEDLPEDSKPLVAPIDRGQTAGVVDLGATYSFLAWWANLGLVYKQGSAYNALDTTLALGSVLPGNSWVQISFHQTQNRDEAESNTETDTIDSSMGVSLGITYYRGMAVELGYQSRTSSDDQWEDGNTWHAGLSLRSL